MRVAKMEYIAASQYRCSIIEIPAGAVAEHDGVWAILSEEDAIKVHEFDAIGYINATRKLKQAAEKHNAAVLEDGEQMAAEMKRAEEEGTRAPDIRGYQLVAWKDGWGDSRLDVGTAPDKVDIRNVASQWEGAGYKTEIQALKEHHLAKKCRYTLKEPYEPAVCLVEDCNWVGDHLASHLYHRHQMNMDDYKAIYQYEGKGTAGAALASIEKAHEAVRRSNNIKVGQFLVSIKGDRNCDVWRVVSINSDSKEVSLTWIAGNGPEREDLELPGKELLRQMKPVGVWSQRIRKEYGGKK